MIVSAPMNEQELRNLMYTAQLRKEGPFTIRYPRGQGVMPEWRTPFEEIEVGKGRMIRDGEEVAILTIGHIGNYAVEACKIPPTNRRVAECMTASRADPCAWIVMPNRSSHTEDG